MSQSSKISDALEGPTQLSMPAGAWEQELQDEPWYSAGSESSNIAAPSNVVDYSQYLVHDKMETLSSLAERYKPDGFIDVAQPNPPLHETPISQDDLNERYITPGAVTSFGNLALSRAVQASTYASHIQDLQLDVFTHGIELCTPLNINTDMRSDRVGHAVRSFRDDARIMIAQGQPANSVLSMDGLDLDLMFRDRNPSDPHTVSTWACEYSKSWTSLPLHIRLATVHFVGTLMRWLIMPCRETYTIMSKLMRPCDAQLLVPHSAHVDVCHLPFIRTDQLIHGGRWVDRITADSQRCHWDKGDDACIVKERLASGKSVWRLNPEFIQFIDDQTHWTLAESVLTDFPHLAGLTRFHQTGE